MVYRTLSEVSGKELPWGDLTGIRPTKIPMKMLEEGTLIGVPRLFLFRRGTQNLN